MRLLLDSHVFIWWVMDNDRLSAEARRILQPANHELFLSSASAWELAIKAGLGKLRLTEPVERFVPQQLLANQIQELPVSIAHAVAVAGLPKHHGDPFDRLLIAQAQMEGLVVISADKAFSAYPIKTLW